MTDLTPDYEAAVADIQRMFRDSRDGSPNARVRDRILATLAAEKTRADKAEQERDEARRDRDHYGSKLDDLLNGNTYTGWVDRARTAEARVAELEAATTPERIAEQMGLMPDDGAIWNERCELIAAVLEARDWSIRSAMGHQNGASDG